MDLRNLPPQLNAPGVPSNLQFSYTLTGRGPVLSGDLQMDESTLADATIAPGTIGSFRIGSGAPEYRGKGTRHQSRSAEDRSRLQHPGARRAEVPEHS